MNYDPCPQKIIEVILKAGKFIREIKGLEEEKNISTLLKETSQQLGIRVMEMNSKKDGGRLPGPHEMKRKDGKPLVPLQTCENCGLDGVEIFSICKGCVESEKGFYKTKLVCRECGEKTMSRKFYAQWLSELGIDFRGGMKIDYGIKTITDEGIK